jgi:hypothetical protein
MLKRKKNFIFYTDVIHPHQKKKKKKGGNSRRRRIFSLVAALLSFLF